MLVTVAGILELGTALEELEDELIRFAAHGGGAESWGNPGGGYSSGN